MLMHSTCMLYLIWMTKPSSRFGLILSAICGKTQISLFSCTTSFHWPFWSIFAVFGHLPKLEMICINYLAMFVHLHCEVQWSYHFEWPGMFVIPSLICLLKVVLLLFWRFLSVVDFTSTSYGFQVAKSRWNLRYYCLRESHWTTIPCSLILWRSTSFSESPGHFTWRLWCFSNLCLIAIPGQIPVHPGWVVCAIWINGSELRTIGPCVFWFRIWHIQQMKKSDDCEDSYRERLNGCTFNSLFYWTDLGI